MSENLKPYNESDSDNFVDVILEEYLSLMKSSDVSGYICCTEARGAT